MKGPPSDTLKQNMKNNCGVQYPWRLIKVLQVKGRLHDKTQELRDAKLIRTGVGGYMFGHFIYHIYLSNALVIYQNWPFSVFCKDISLSCNSR